MPHFHDLQGSLHQLLEDNRYARRNSADETVWELNELERRITEGVDKITHKLGDKGSGKGSVVAGGDAQQQYQAMGSDSSDRAARRARAPARALDENQQQPQGGASQGSSSDMTKLEIEFNRVRGKLKSMKNGPSTISSV